MCMCRWILHIVGIHRVSRTLPLLLLYTVHAAHVHLVTHYRGGFLAPVTFNANAKGINRNYSACDVIVPPENGGDKWGDMHALAGILELDNNPSLTRQVESRMAKLKHLQSDYGMDGYPSWENGQTPVEGSAVIANEYAKLKPGEEVSTRQYNIAGRIHSIRFNGLFVVIVDSNGDDLQIMFKNDGQFCMQQPNMEPNILKFDDIEKLLDLGDVVEIHGTSVKRTSAGELTLIASGFKITAKCLLPLPNAWHGIKNPEAKQRQRHVDIMTCPETRNMLKMRSKVISSIRNFLHAKGFLEVETPILQVTSSGANSNPFKTFHKSLGTNVHLRIAPEFNLKRLLVAGLGNRLFEIGKCFRNEGTSPIHSPEFTMLELYQTNCNMSDIMQLFQDLVNDAITSCEKKSLGACTAPLEWTTITIAGAFERYLGVDLYHAEKGRLLQLLSDSHGGTCSAAEVDENASWGTLVEAVFEHKIQKHLVEPTHVCYYPRDTSPLAKPYDELTSCKFESFIRGIEIAHACTEETDILSLSKVLKNHGSKTGADAIDEEFYNAMAHGLPPCGGLGIGIDRLVMVLGNACNIKETLAFSLPRPLPSS